MSTNNYVTTNKDSYVFQMHLICAECGHQSEGTSSMFRNSATLADELGWQESGTRDSWGLMKYLCPKCVVAKEYMGRLVLIDDRSRLELGLVKEVVQTGNYPALMVLSSSASLPNRMIDLQRVHLLPSDTTIPPWLAARFIKEESK